MSHSSESEMNYPGASFGPENVIEHQEAQVETNAENRGTQYLEGLRSKYNWNVAKTCIYEGAFLSQGLAAYVQLSEAFGGSGDWKNYAAGFMLEASAAVFGALSFKEIGHAISNKKKINEING